MRLRIAGMCATSFGTRVGSARLELAAGRTHSGRERDGSLMNVLFVHGFGGAKGRMERALADAARGGPHYLLSVRWPSGDLREMRARAVVEVARKVAEHKSIPKGLMQAAMLGGKQA